MTDEFYARPIFRVGNVEASIVYYCEKLGFERGWSFPDDTPIIAQVGRNGLDVTLDAQSVLPKPKTPSVLSLSLHQSENLGALYLEFEARGAKIVSSTFEVSWEQGVYQFDVEDLDGNVLVFWGENPG